VVFDVTHSLQLPGAGDGVTAGQAEFIEPLASAGVAAGVDGSFLEIHDNPAQAKSDARNALDLSRLPALLTRLARIHAALDAPGRRVGGLVMSADLSLARKVLETEANAILELVERVGQDFAVAVDLLHQCRGRVIVTGMGKSGDRLPQDRGDALEHRDARVLPPSAEAIHGDLGVIQADGRRAGALLQRRDRGSAARARVHSPHRGEAHRRDRESPLEPRTERRTWRSTAT